MKSYLSALKGAYPDFWVEIDQIGASGCELTRIGAFGWRVAR